MDVVKKEIKIAIVEDDIFYAEALRKYIDNEFSKSGNSLDVKVNHYLSAQQCLEETDADVDIILLDYYLEDDAGDIPFPGISLLRAINSYWKRSKVIVISGQNNQEVTIELFQNGIYEYIMKDEQTFSRLSSTLRRAIREKILDYYI
ncbi:response regulator [Fulvivirga sediminis]|uniref:Response regulator n=1 Tax=Fulvivirga sediminis TaxID=2803949 RepID=A0A937K0T7_9BACT|nr:response regulator [Fulvivirga sediminis]MBL3656635.1 response regulator [Fulvivirga sediminis]